MKTINKDFYKDLPGMVCMQLDDMFIPTLQKIDGERFDNAWEVATAYKNPTISTEIG